MTTPSIILGRVVQLNAALFQIMMVSNIFLKMWVIYYHRLIMPNTAAGWHLLPEVGWREPGGFALSVEQFLGRNFAAGPAFLPEPWEVFRSLQRAGCTWFSPVSGRIDGYPYLSLFRDHKNSFSSHGGSWAGGAQLLCFTFPVKSASTVPWFAGHRHPHPWPRFLVQVETSNNFSSPPLNA